MIRKIIALLTSTCIIATVFSGCTNTDISSEDNFEEDDDVQMVLNETDDEDTSHSRSFINSKPKTEQEYEGTTVDIPLDENASVSPETYPLYFMDTSNEESIELAFFDEKREIPYISVEETAGLLNLIGIYDGYPSSFGVEYSEEGNKAILTRETGYSMIADPDEDTITFLDYDAFIAEPGAIRLIQMVSQRDDNEDFGSLFKHSDYSYQRYGNVIVLQLGKYNIDILKTDLGCFIPLATVNDFLTSCKYYNLLFNGEAVIVLAYNGLYTEDYDLTDIALTYYDVRKKKISEQFAAFSYNELCLMLDNLYGLKEHHDINNFDAFLDNVGLKDELLSTDTETIDNAIMELLNVHLDDLHSGFIAPSCYTGAQEIVEQSGLSNDAFDTYMEKLADVRSRYYLGDVPVYEEVGNTAYITFDSFSGIPYGVDYYEKAPDENVTDTIGIILYSFQQIKRPGSPVENVVLDMSLNTGGNIEAAGFVIGAFLGEGTYSIRDSFTGALTTDNYYVDANLDNRFNEEDSLEGYNLYCLESPVSFSCGNLVPCIFKSSHKVTLLGQTSGGGTCSVLPMTSAIGTTFQISGNYQMSFAKNGSFYDIDIGAEPDFCISKFEHFYDRKQLTNYINNLY